MQKGFKDMANMMSVGQSYKWCLNYGRTHFFTDYCTDGFQLRFHFNGVQYTFSGVVCTKGRVKDTTSHEVLQLYGCEHATTSMLKDRSFTTINKWAAETAHNDITLSSCR